MGAAQSGGNMSGIKPGRAGTMATYPILRSQPTFVPRKMGKPSLAHRGDGHRAEGLGMESPFSK